MTKAITKCFEKGERILIFDDYCPWKSHMFDIEEKLGKAGEILYVLYPEDGSTRETGNGAYKQHRRRPTVLPSGRACPSLGEVYGTWN